MSPLQPKSTLFPYTTLFRSLVASGAIRVPIAATYPLTAFREAVAHVQRGGKVMFDVDGDRKSTRLNSSHEWSSYAVFCLKKKTSIHTHAASFQFEGSRTGNE